MKLYEVPVWEKVTMTVEEAAAFSSVGVNKIRELLKDPRCPFALHVGQGKTLVKRIEFVDFISKRIEI